MKDMDFAQLTKAIMKANNWDEAYTYGYLDGKRDRFFGLKSYVNSQETTDYSHGYRRGYNETLI